MSDPVKISTDAAPKPTPEVVTLCGSMRHFNEMMQVASTETSAGRVVLAPFPAKASQAEHDALHRRKIDLSSGIVVVTCGGYIGESTAGEIAYAEQAGKAVRYIEVYPERADREVFAHRRILRGPLGSLAIEGRFASAGLFTIVCDDGDDAQYGEFHNEETLLSSGWEEITRAGSDGRQKARPTLAETRTGTDWCPRCLNEVGTDRYTQESSTLERCGICGSVLIPPPVWVKEDQ